MRFFGYFFAAALLTGALYADGADVRLEFGADGRAFGQVRVVRGEAVAPFREIEARAALEQMGFTVVATNGFDTGALFEVRHPAWSAVPVGDDRPAWRRDGIEAVARIPIVGQDGGSPFLPDGAKLTDASFSIGFPAAVLTAGPSGRIDGNRYFLTLAAGQVGAGPQVLEIRYRRFEDTGIRKGLALAVLCAAFAIVYFHFHYRKILGGQSSDAGERSGAERAE